MVLRSAGTFVLLATGISICMGSIVTGQKFPDQEIQEAERSGPSPYLSGFYNSHAVRSDKSIMNADILLNDSSLDDNFDRTMDLVDREQGCLKSCKDHGQCDSVSQRCVCETFWMSNPVNYRMRPYRPNCDWNVFFVIGTLIGIVFGLIVIAIVIHACCRRCYFKETKLPNRRYRLIPDDDLEGFGRGGDGLRIKRAQMVDSDTDEEEAVFEARNPKFYGAQTNVYTKPGEHSKAKAAQ